MSRLLIVGTRKAQDEQIAYVRRLVERCIEDDRAIIVGDSPDTTDSLVVKFAQELGLPKGQLTVVTPFKDCRIETGEYQVIHYQAPRGFRGAQFFRAHEMYMCAIADEAMAIGSDYHCRFVFRYMGQIGKKRYTTVTAWKKELSRR